MVIKDEHNYQCSEDQNLYQESDLDPLDDLDLLEWIQ